MLMYRTAHCNYAVKFSVLNADKFQRQDLLDMEIQLVLRTQTIILNKCICMIRFGPVSWELDHCYQMKMSLPPPHLTFTSCWVFSVSTSLLISELLLKNSFCPLFFDSENFTSRSFIPDLHAIHCKMFPSF